jgi:hypothetical protein
MRMAGSLEYAFIFALTLVTNVEKLRAPSRGRRPV